MVQAGNASCAGRGHAPGRPAPLSRDASRVRLQCPRCAGSELTHAGSAYECACDARFPIVDGSAAKKVSRGMPR